MEAEQLKKVPEEFSLSDFPDEDDNNEVFDDTYKDYNISPDVNAELAKVLIETESYINRVQLTLENKYIKQVKTTDRHGKIVYSKIPTQIPGTRPLANSFGISQIMGRVKSVIHHAMSLGYIDKLSYGKFLARFIRDFTRSLISHRLEWGINAQDLRDIRRNVVDGVQLYLTRPIGRVEFTSLTKFNTSQDNHRDNSGFLDKVSDRFKKKNGRMF